MVENKKRELTASEYLKLWVEEACYEILPTEKALGLVDLIPENNIVRVTCRPTGVEDTVWFMEALGSERAKRVIPHVAAKRLLNESHFNDVFARLLTAGAESLFVVGGDGKASSENYVKAQDVLIALHERNIKFEKIGIGGYPEGNPVFDMDPTEVLLIKQEMAEKMGQPMEIVTQMCFDVDALFGWIDEIRQRGVYLPVVVGVPGQIKIETLFKVLPTLGITDVLSFIKSKPKLAKCIAGGVFGGFSPDDLMRELSEKNYPDSGISGISVFTLGSVSKSVKSMNDLIQIWN